MKFVQGANQVSPPVTGSQADGAPSEAGWFSDIADRVLAAFPDEESYTCAAGISPSGAVHFGNFRDVITSLAVAQELRSRGRQARLLFSWDEYDRFRKVPSGVDPAFSRYIGMPLTAVPDPWGERPSYARRFEQDFEQAMQTLGIELDYRYQTEEYRSGRYDDLIVHALRHRDTIAAILFGFMSDKSKEKRELTFEDYRRSYYPVTVYSRFSGTDKCEILDYDGDSTLTYKCLVTGKTDTIDLRQDRIVKLSWKIDWPMRWCKEQVHFEPGGHDHATPGGSFDVSSRIVREVFDAPAPVFQGYLFIGLQGLTGKMSGSTGQAVSPGTLLRIYEPGMLKWLYLRRAPTHSFNLAFDTEVYRQYDEFDREVAAFDRLPAARRKTLEFSGAAPPSAPPSVPGTAPPIPFRQAVAFGQIVQWERPKLDHLLDRMGVAYDPASLDSRLPRARNWLELYNPDEAIVLLEAPNGAYAAGLDAPARDRVRRLRAFLAEQGHTVAELEECVYGIPRTQGLPEGKELKAAQRRFFKDVYNLLIGRDTGPRLATFLWAIDRNRVLRLLDI